MPEWATDDMAGGDEGGTFDASGAFLSLKDIEDTSNKKPDRKAKDQSQDKSEQPTKKDVSSTGVVCLI